MTTSSTACSDTCDLLEAVLAGSFRDELLDEICRTGQKADWLRRLRASMAAHAFRSSRATFDFSKLVRVLDLKTRQDGFRVLHTWDHKAHGFTDDIVPVLMLDFYQRSELHGPTPRQTLAILLDFYFLHVLALGAMRAWDEPSADAVLERLSGLVGALQGSDGSGHRFVEDAETLLIYALSQFHPEETAYDRLIEKVVTLAEDRQVRFALASAAVLSAHLRWGFWLMYDRDVLRMRNDNVGDYPWLLNSVATLMRAYTRAKSSASDAERAVLAEGLLLGLAADPWAFTEKAPPALASYGSVYAEFRGLLAEHGDGLQKDIEAHRPGKESYSPLSLHFNFPHNTLVAIVTLALLEAKPQPLSLNTLFVGEREGVGEETQERLARTLMAFSGGSRERLGAHGALLVAYDPYSGLRSFTMTRDALKRLVSPA